MPINLVRLFGITALVLAGLAASAPEASALTLTPASGSALPNATQFTFYSTTLTAGGVPATPPYSWVVTGLPTGIAWSSSGANNEIVTLSGTPTVSGAITTISLTATDSKTPNARTANGTYTLTIDPTCIFTGSSTGSISFGSGGNIDPSTTPGPIINTVPGQINLLCGAGLAYTVAVTNPPGALQMTGANTIPFTLGIASGTSNSDTTPIPLLGPSASPAIPASEIFNFENFVVGTSSIGPLTVNISWAGAAPGSLNATVNVVNANVMDTCSAPTTGSLSFTIDPAAAGPLVVSTPAYGTAPTIMCTSGQSHAVSCNPLHGSLTIGNDGVTDPIAYTIPGCPVNVTGSGFLTPVSMDLGLSLQASDYQDAQASGTPHSDTITVQVTY